MPTLTNIHSYDALELIERAAKPETRVKSIARKHGFDRLRERQKKSKRGRPRNS